MRLIGSFAERRIIDNVIRSHSLLESGGIDEWLKGRSGLTVCLCGMIKFACRKVITADHRHDLSGLVIEQNEGGLDFRFWFEPHHQNLSAEVYRFNLKLGQIAAFKKF